VIAIWQAVAIAILACGAGVALGMAITAALCRAADDGDDVDRMFAGADAIDGGDA